MNTTLFLEARHADDRPAAALIQGVPWEGGVSWRGGTAEGPGAVRAASQSIESWSPRTGRDLMDVNLADAGDIAVEGVGAPEAIAAIARTTELHARTAALVVTIGGDHSISIGTSQALRAVYPDLIHLVYDAHMDLRPEYEGDPLSHACGTRHMATAGPACVLGVRSGAREEFTDAEDLLVAWSEGLEPPPVFRPLLAERPVFVSVDLDVLDPSIFAGTGNPEPGGPTYRELRESLLGLSGLRIVGLDLVELAPRLDASGVSAVVAAELLRDVVLGVLPA